MTELTVQWALWSKEPHDSRDYRVLRSSAGPLAEPELERLISRYIPAQPPGSRQPGPGALPWVTFSPAPGPDGAALGVSVLDLTDSSDYSRRKIAPTRYLRFPFRDLHAGRVAYAEIAERAMLAELPDRSRDPLPLAVGRSDPGAVAAVIDRLGFERLAAVAGLLLNTRVLLLTNVSPTGLDRVEILDAIAALLPFGFRAALVASTWTGQGNEEARLGFGGDPDRAFTAVEWDAGSVPQPTYDPGQRYLELLLQLRAKHGSARVVAHLVADGEPRTFADAPAAYAALSRLDRIGVLSLEARRGTADLAQVRTALAGEDAQAQAPETLAALLGFLLQKGQPEDRTLVEASLTLDLWPHLVAAAGQELMYPDAGRRAWHLQLAGRLGREEQLLIELLGWARDRTYHQAWTAQAEVIRMARQALIPAELEQPDGGWRSLAEQIGARRERTYEVMAQEVEAGAFERLPALLAWLGRGVGEDVPWLRTFRAALGLDWTLPALSYEDLRDAASFDHRHAVAMFAVARRSGRAGTAFQGAWTWLLTVADELDAAQRQRWLAELEGLDDPADLLRLDLLRLRFRSADAFPLRRRLLDASPEDTLKYREAFEQTYRAPALDRVRQHLWRPLVAAVESQPWTSPPELADRVLALLAVMFDASEWSGDGGQEVRTAIVRAVGGAAADADLTELPAYQRRWAPLVASHPELVASTAVARMRRELRYDLPPARLAALCADVIAANRLGDMMRALRGTANPLTGPTLHSFLDDVGSALRQRRWHEHRIADACESVVRAVLEERLGRPLALDYIEWLKHDLPRSLQLAAWLVTRVRGNLDEQQLATLHSAAAEIGRNTEPPSWTDRIPLLRPRR